MKKALYLVTLTSPLGVEWQGAFETLTEANKFVERVKAEDEITDHFAYDLSSLEFSVDSVTLFSEHASPTLLAIDDLCEDLFGPI